MTARRHEGDRGTAESQIADPVYPSDQELYDDDRLNSIPRYDEQFGM